VGPGTRGARHFLPRPVVIDGVGRAHDPFGIVVKLADGHVACEAEQPANPGGVMVMVDVKMLRWPRLPPTDRAAATLGGEQSVVLVEGQAELPPKVSGSVFAPTETPVQRLIRLDALGVLMLPLGESADL
jgi:hypothetical protein